jgi:hypothetical protein
MFDVVLFGALKKHAIGLEVLNEDSETVVFILKLYYDFKQAMVEINIWRVLSAIGFTHDITHDPYGLLLIRKSSDKVAASWSSGSATRLERACRRGINEPSLNGLTNQNKSIWSKILAVLPARNEDVRPTI